MPLFIPMPSSLVPIRLACVCLLAGFGPAARAAETFTGDGSRTQPAYEMGVGVLGWRTSGPFTGITKNFRENPIPYRMVVTTASVAQRIPTDRPILRNLELVHTAVWSAITRGPENHWGGLVTGLRYYYPLPSRWHTALFVSWQGGVGAIDSSGLRYAQERDLTFTFLNAVGIQTHLSESLDLHVQLLGQHISNGWQTHPSEGIDCSGFSLALRYRLGLRR